MDDGAGDLVGGQAPGEHGLDPGGQAQGLHHGTQAVLTGGGQGLGRRLGVRPGDGGGNGGGVGDVGEELLGPGAQGRSGLLDAAPDVARPHAPGVDGVVVRVPGGHGAHPQVPVLGLQDQGRQGLLVPAQGTQVQSLTGVHDHAPVQGGQADHRQGPLQERGLQGDGVGAQRGDDHGAQGGRVRLPDGVVGGLTRQVVEGGGADDGVGVEVPGQAFRQLGDPQARDDATTRGRGDGHPALGVGQERQGQEVLRSRIPLQAGEDPLLVQDGRDLLGGGPGCNENTLSTVPALVGLGGGHARPPVCQVTGPIVSGSTPLRQPTRPERRLQGADAGSPPPPPGCWRRSGTTTYGR